jgi:hypothetical protein
MLPVNKSEPANKSGMGMQDCPPSAQWQQQSLRSSDLQRPFLPSQNGEVDGASPVQLPAVDRQMEFDVHRSMPSSTAEGDSNEHQDNFIVPLNKALEPGDTVIVLTGQALGSTGRLVSIQNDEAVAVVDLERGPTSLKIDDIRLLEPRSPQLAPLARAKKPAKTFSHEIWALPAERPPLTTSQMKVDEKQVAEQGWPDSDGEADVWSIPSETSPNAPRLSPPSDVLKAKEIPFGAGEGSLIWLRQELEEEVGRTAADAVFKEGKYVAEVHSVTSKDLTRQYTATPKVDIKFRDLMLMAPPIGTGTNKTVYKATWRKTVVVSALLFSLHGRAAKALAEAPVSIVI